MLIDHHLPNEDVRIARETTVAADAEACFQALRTAKIGADPVVRTLAELRELPARLAGALRGEAEPGPRPGTLQELLDGDHWTLLAEEPRRELVAGLVGRFWLPIDMDLRRVPGESFRGFGQPGYAKAALSLRVQPAGPQSCRVTYELRMAATDPKARTRLEIYWRVIGPFTRLLMDRALEAIEEQAELLAARSVEQQEKDAALPGSVSKGKVPPPPGLSGAVQVHEEPAVSPIRRRKPERE